jgi:hypothetical protein
VKIGGVKGWPYFLHFSPVLGEIWYRIRLEKCVKKARGERRHLHTEGVNKLLSSYFSTLVVRFGCVRCASLTELLGTFFEFRGNHYRESPVFPTDVSGT